MYSFSVCLLRHFKRFKNFDVVVKQSPLRSDGKRFYSKGVFPQVAGTEGIDTDEYRSFFDESRGNLKHADFTEVTKALSRYSYPESIKWEEVLTKLKDLQVSNPRNTIILTCIRLEKLDVGLSFYKYLSQTQAELTPNELLLFTKLMQESADSLPKFQEVVLGFYEKVKMALFSSPSLKQFGLGIFVRFPSCFWDAVENIRKSGLRQGNQVLVHRAFEIDAPEVGWDFIQDSDFICNKEFLNIYIDYCIRRAAEGKFSVDLINDLVNICSKRMWYLRFNNFQHESRSLLEAIQNNKNEYSLSVNNCTIDLDSVCSNCGLQLRENSISEDELNALKEDFFDDVINNSKVFLHSSKREVNDFKIFLENCQPYNFVIDGLNLLYAGKVLGTKMYSHLLKYFLNKNFKILVIGRNHSKSLLRRPIFLKEKRYAGCVQFFFTANRSDDDLFTLYSAMHGGPSTFFCSGDHLSSYHSNLSVEKKILFRKWKISHQYLIKPDNTLLPPWSHMGLSQLTSTPTEECNSYTWHLSHVLSDMTLNRNKHINWSCVKAIPRNIKK